MKDNRRKWLLVGVIAILAWICAKWARAVLKANVTNTSSYETSHTVVENHAENLILETGAAEVSIVKGNESEAFTIETNISNLNIDDDERILTIDDGTSLFMDDQAWIRLIIPDGYIFKNVEIDTGAGTLTIEDLTSDYLELDLGAGAVTVDHMTVPVEADISTGAGRLFIKDCLMKDAGFDLGTGEAVIHGQLLGDNKISCGIGKVDLVLKGNDYTIDFDSGVGKTQYNGKIIQDGTYGSGINRIEIDGGIGDISVLTE